MAYFAAPILGLVGLGLFLILGAELSILEIGGALAVFIAGAIFGDALTDGQRSRASLIEATLDGLELRVSNAAEELCSPCHERMRRVVEVAKQRPS